jgi:hypothetical protein
MGYRFDETKGCGVDCEMSQGSGSRGGYLDKYMTKHVDEDGLRRAP